MSGPSQGKSAGRACPSTATVSRMRDVNHRRQHQGSRLALRGIAGHRLEVMRLKVAATDRLIAILEELSHAQRGEAVVAEQAGHVQRDVGSLLLDLRGRLDGRGEGHFQPQRLGGHISHHERGFEQVLPQTMPAVDQSMPQLGAQRTVLGRGTTGIEPRRLRRRFVQQPAAAVEQTGRSASNQRHAIPTHRREQGRLRLARPPNPPAAGRTCFAARGGNRDPSAGGDTGLSQKFASIHGHLPSANMVSRRRASRQANKSPGIAGRRHRLAGTPPSFCHCAPDFLFMSPSLILC